MTEDWQEIDRSLQALDRDCNPIITIAGGLAIVKCGTFEIADALNRELRRERVPGIVEIWTDINGQKRRYNVVRPLPKSGSFMETLICKNMAAAQLIEFAESQTSCCEITSMGLNKTLYTNGKDCQKMEGVIWTPDQFVGFNALQYWQGFESDLESLLKGLKQDGRIDGFKFRNRRIDGGINEFVKDYFMTMFMGVPCRVSVTKDWKSL